MRMTRRLARALALGLIVSLVAGGVAVASAPAARAQDDDTIPDAFAFAAARNGERGAYDALLQGEWGGAPAMGTWFRLANYTREAGDHIRDGNGRDLAVDVLRVEALQDRGSFYSNDVVFGTYAIEGESTWERRAMDIHFLAGTREIVAVDTPSHETIVVDEAISPLGGNATGTTQLNRTERAYMSDDGRLCAIDFPWQGLTLPAQGLQLTESCELAGILRLPAGSVFHATRWEDKKGLRSLRFDLEPNPQEADDEWSFTVGGETWTVGATVEALQFWMAPGVSVPLAMHWSDSRGREAQLALVGYELGTALPGLPTQPGPAWGPMRTTAPRPWGPDDTGVDHAFPLSAAYAVARDDPRCDAAGSWMRDHPDAMAWRANYEEIVDDVMTRTWHFALADDFANLDVTVQRSWYPSPDRLLVLDECSTGGGADAWMLPADPPEAWPARVPTVDALWDRWSVVAGKDAGAPNSWGFVYVPLGDDRVFVMSTAGIVREIHTMGVQSDPADPLVTQAVSLEASVITFADDYAMWFEETTQLDASGAGLVGTRHAPNPGSVIGFQAAEASTLLPGPSQAAGASVLGIFAGLAYYLWPIVKSGGLTGLFSRLSKPEVLEHPQRVRIVQAIEANPGIHFQELMRTTGLANGALVHHVRKLESANAIVARKSSGYTCYFVRGVDRRDMDGAETARAPGAKAILETVRSRPGITSQETADLTGLAPSTSGVPRAEARPGGPRHDAARRARPALAPR